MAAAGVTWYLMGDSNTGSRMTSFGKIPCALAQLLQCPSLQIVPLGVSGSTGTAGKQYYMETATFRNTVNKKRIVPDGVVLALGTNDVHSPKCSEESFGFGIRFLLEFLLKTWPAAKFIVLSPLSVSRHVDKFLIQVQTVVNQMRGSCVEFSNCRCSRNDFKDHDKKHLSVMGAQRIASLLAPYVLATMPETPPSLKEAVVCAKLVCASAPRIKIARPHMHLPPSELRSDEMHGVTICFPLYGFPFPSSSQFPEFYGRLKGEREWCKTH